MNRASQWFEELANSEQAWEVGNALFVSEFSSTEVKFMSVVSQHQHIDNTSFVSHSFELILLQTLMQTYLGNAFGAADDATRVQIRDAAIELLLTAAASRDRVVLSKTALLVVAVAYRSVPESWSEVVPSIFEAHAEAVTNGSMPEDMARIGALTFCKEIADEILENPLSGPTRTALAVE